MNRIAKETTATWLHPHNIRGYIQKFPDWVDKEIYTYNNKNSLRSNTKCYGGKSHKADSQNSDTTAPSGRTVPFAVVTPAG